MRIRIRTFYRVWRVEMFSRWAGWEEFGKSSTHAGAVVYAHDMRMRILRDEELA